MTSKIFMSYSWKDSAIASRLYGDLVNSHLKVWRDQVDGDPICDFQSEFLREIEECDYFLMLDSSNYRKKSSWCDTEVRHCLEVQKRRNGYPKIIVCLLEPNGSWRTEYKNEEHRSVFEAINRLKYRALYFDRYDNDAAYIQTVNFICSTAGREYIPWNSLPSTQDLLDELTRDDNGALTVEDRKLILSEYEIILRQAECCRPNIREHYRLWIDDCRTCGARLFFPQWTYAIWLCSDAGRPDDDDEAERIFRSLTEAFPDEPRAYRAWGCAAARNGRYEQALHLLHEAYEKMQNPAHSKELALCEYEVLFNIGQTYMNLREFSQASAYLDKAYVNMTENGFFDMNLIANIDKCRIELKMPAERRLEFLGSLIDRHKTEAELYVLYGLCCAEAGRNRAASESLQKAYSLQPSAQNLFYMLCRNENHSVSADSLVEMLKDYGPGEEDSYWTGAIYYYILNDRQTALSFYNKCNPQNYEWYADI